MTRSFDRRGGYPGGNKPVGELMPPPANIRSASIRGVQPPVRRYVPVNAKPIPGLVVHKCGGTKVEEPVSLDLDCMCDKNDPNCAECWVPVAQHAADIRLSEFDIDVRYRFDECLELLLRKHKDYGPSNIANAPGGPLNGLRVRMHDKISRINNLIDKGIDPQNESLRDSFLDLANYAVIALLCLDERWPSE